MVKQKVKTASNLLLLLMIAGAFVGNDTEQSINLCTDTEVDYENYTESRTEVCGCEQRHSCVRKCCQSGFHHFHNESPDDEFYVSRCYRVRTNATSFVVPIYDGLKPVYLEDKFMVGMLDCKNERFQYFKMSNADPRQKVYIQKNGSLYYPFYGKMYNNDRYCVDEKEGLTAYLCFWPRNTVSGNTERTIQVLAKVTPLPFLLITFVVYALLPELSIHGRALMRHVLSLSIANSAVVTVEYYKIHGNVLCQLLGYAIVFFMLASFFWMNVMCTDIWLAFSALRPINLERKLFMLCYIYAWGHPFIIIFVMFFMNTYGDKNSPFYPGMGTDFCFINGHLQIFLYYFGPILILVIVNTILFILTAINIQKVKRETSMLQQTGSRRHASNAHNKKKFSLYWKLLFAMGINPVINVHVIQAVSWSAGSKLDDGGKYIFYIKDIAHTLYGIFIFITYTCKKSVWRDLKKKYFMLIGRPILSNYVPQTALSSLSISDGANTSGSNNIKDMKDELV